MHAHTVVNELLNSEEIPRHVTLILNRKFTWSGMVGGNWGNLQLPKIERKRAGRRDPGFRLLFWAGTTKELSFLKLVLLIAKEPVV
jgi:hypothetical protein